MLAPVEAEPAHVALDRVDIFLLFLGRIGVVVTQIALSAELLGDAEIQADRLGVADMQIAVGLGRKAGDDRLVPARCEIGPHNVADKILARFACRRVWRCHGVICFESYMSGRISRPHVDSKAASARAGVDKLALQVKSASPSVRPAFTFAH